MPDRVRMQTIYNFVEASKIQDAARAQCEIPPRFPTVIFMGRLEQVKGVDRLIRAFDGVTKQMPQARLLVVGGGSQEDELKRLASSLGLENSILFVGSHQNPFRYLRLATVYVCASRYEGFPNALLEAECSGLLCVSSSTITKEVMFDSCICLSLNDSLSDWADALAKEKIKNRERYSHVIEEKGYGVKSEVKKLEDIYLELSGDSNG